MSTDQTIEPTLEELTQQINPENLSYYTTGGALPSKAFAVVTRIRQVRDGAMLLTLQAHVLGQSSAEKPYGATYPIGIIQRAITEQLESIKKAA